MMPLCVLHIEECDDDAALIARLLASNLDRVAIIHRVREPADLTSAVVDAAWDLILTDTTLGGQPVNPQRWPSSERLRPPVVVLTRGAIRGPGALAAGVDAVIDKGQPHELEPALLRAAARASATPLVARSFRVLLERSPLAAMLVDETSDVIVAANPAAALTYGYSRESLEQMRLAQLSSARGSAATGPLGHGPLDVETFGHALEASGGRLRLLLVRDVSTDARLSENVKRGQALVHQAQKMEALGRLAAGVAHDFNNILSIILTFAQLAAQQLADDHPARADIQEMKLAAQRASALTHQLLAFSRGQAMDRSAIDLGMSVAGMAKMLQTQLGDRVRLDVRAAGAGCRVWLGDGEVEQVVMNLVLNARDAMPGGGTITVSTEPVEIDDLEVALQPDAQPGSYVRLTVADSGAGIDPATLEHVFEPFFTTKTGRGSGLGLAIVHGIVSQGHGHIRVQSQPGLGTVFELYFPRYREAAAPVAVPQQGPWIYGTETVLLSGGVELVQARDAAALRSYGYTVIVARDGEEARLACESYAPPVHLLIIEVSASVSRVPRASVQRALQLRPGLRVLYVTGLPPVERARAGLTAADDVLVRPFQPDDLALRVRRAIDRGLPSSGGVAIELGSGVGAAVTTPLAAGPRGSSHAHRR